MSFREITAEDVPALFAVRTATRENAYTRAELEAIGITESTVRAKLQTSYAGWLCEAEGRVVGFSMADRNTGELWVIAVLPAFEGRGMGSRLLRLVENWLVACGCNEFWLTTGVDTSLRAYGFYRKHGWEDAGIRDNLRYMKKDLREARGSDLCMNLSLGGVSSTSPTNPGSRIAPSSEGRS